VLVAGGYDGTGYLADVRLYDPAANSWSAAAALSVQRSSHVAVALPSGKVLVAGGYGDDGFGHLGQQATSEIYDPAANDWLPAGSLNTPRMSATATLLRNGSVILAGGVGVPSTAGVENTGYVFATEMYDPTLDQWAVVGPLHHARSTHSATLLPSGKILVAGGEDFGGLVTAETFDPVTQLWSLPINMGAIRLGHAAVLLSSGRVLLAGGYNANGYLTSSEYYDEEFPVGGHWSAAGSLPAPRRSPSLTLMPNGKVLLSGGSDVALATLTFDPATNNWSGSGALAQARRAHSATLLGSGKVLVAGGFVTVDTVTSYVESAELYDPASDTWSSAGTLATARAFHTATLLPSGKVLVAGGDSANGGAGVIVASADLYDPATGLWAPTGPLTTPRTGHTATLLASGKVLLVLGGLDSGDNSLGSAELYDPATERSESVRAMSVPRESHTATLLEDGRVLVIGGHNGRRQNMEVYGSAEIFSPRTGRFEAAGALAIPRHKHDALRLADGRVLVIGGADRSDRVYFSSTEIYDPKTGAFEQGPTMRNARYKIAGSSLLMSDRSVLVASGATAPEIIDPHAQRVSQVHGQLPAAYHFAATAALGDGGALIVGGYDDENRNTAGIWRFRSY